ncbi:MAG: hypothetical protein HY722_16430 [Planctomycetes bacterium]|nr:hypothetical protein [Planctomycetota bacterium]
MERTGVPGRGLFDDLHRLKGALEAHGGRFGAPEAGGAVLSARIEEALADMAARLERALETLASRPEPAPPPPPPLELPAELGERLARLEEALRRPVELPPVPADLLRRLDLLEQALLERLDSGAGKEKEATTMAAIEALGQGIEEGLGGLRDAMGQAVERAAAAGVEKPAKGLPAAVSKRLEALEESLKVERKEGVKRQEAQWKESLRALEGSREELTKRLDALQTAMTGDRDEVGSRLEAVQALLEGKAGGGEGALAGVLEKRLDQRLDRFEHLLNAFAGRFDNVQEEVDGILQGVESLDELVRFVQERLNEFEAPEGGEGLPGPAGGEAAPS